MLGLVANLITVIRLKVQMQFPDYPKAVFNVTFQAKHKRNIQNWRVSLFFLSLWSEKLQTSPVTALLQIHYWGGAKSANLLGASEESR